MKLNARNFFVLGGAFVIVSGLGYWYIQSSDTTPSEIASSTVIDQSPSSTTSSSTEIKSVPTVPDVAWVRHSDPMGYTFSTPSTWKAIAPEQGYEEAFATYSTRDIGNIPKQQWTDIIAVKVVPITQLKYNWDPSAETRWDSVNKQWLRIDCTDYDLVTSCDNAHDIKTTVISSNISVGGVPSWGLANQIPSYVLVPVNESYGLIIRIGITIDNPDKSFADELPAINREILNTFMFK